MRFDRIKASYEALREKENRTEKEDYLFGLLDSVCKLIDCLEGFEVGNRDFDAIYDLTEFVKHLESSSEEAKFVRGFLHGET